MAAQLVPHSIEYLMSGSHLVPVELHSLLVLDTQIIVLRTLEIVVIVVMAEILKLTYIRVVVVRNLFGLG